MDPVAHICAVTGARGAAPLERVQSLWRGWGSLVRYQLVDGPVDTVIVKHIRVPDGADQSVGDRRKRRSYEVEQAFYARWAIRCPVRVPRVWSAEPGLFVLEDLDAAGFPGRAVGAGSLSDARIEQSLAWLAGFHAAFAGVQADDLWPVGTYWHLETRPDEWAALAEGRLKAGAGALDAALRAVPATLVHGDAKVANLCFGASGVAAVDFQYCGHGCGLSDVAYFLGSVLDDAALHAHAEGWLDAYFDALDRADLEAAWRPVWPHAWADFERFMAGWSPGHWKRSSFAAAMVDRALS